MYNTIKSKFNCVYDHHFHVQGYNFDEIMERQAVYVQHNWQSMSSLCVTLTQELRIGMGLGVIF